MINKIKVIIKKSKFLFSWSVFIYNTLIKVDRVIKVHLMILFLPIFPKYIYKLSEREVLPSPEKKISLKNLKFPPLEIINSKSDLLPIMEEINFVSTGCNDFSFLHNSKVPTFLSAFWDTLKINDDGKIVYQPEWHPSFSVTNKNKKKEVQFKEYHNENLIYIHSLSYALKKIKDRGNKVISFISNYENTNGEFYGLSDEISIKPQLEGYKSYNCFLKTENIQKINFIEKIFKPLNPPKNKRWIKGFAPVNSFLSYLSVMFNFAKKINVFGWNFYLNESPKKMSSYELLNKIYDYNIDRRSHYLLEAALLNIYYSFKFSKNSKIKINGYMGDLNNHKRLITDIEKVFFN